jgi:hypothetical protein
MLGWWGGSEKRSMSGALGARSDQRGAGSWDFRDRPKVADGRSRRWGTSVRAHKSGLFRGGSPSAGIVGKFPDRATQLPRIDRLHHVSLEARCEHVAVAVEVPVAGDRDDRHSRSLR